MSETDERFAEQSEAKRGAKLVESHGRRVRGRGFESRRLHCLCAGILPRRFLCHYSPNCREGLFPEAQFPASFILGN